MALNFSDADKAKYMTGQYLKEIKLYFPELSLTVLNDEIYSESLSLEESIFDGNGELSIIGCISNRFGIEIRNQSVQLKNQSIEVSIRIDGGSWNRLFTGYVESVETVRDRSYQKIQCYDALYKWQSKNYFSTYSALTFPITIKNLRDSIFTFTGIIQEETTLVNDTVSIMQTIDDGEIAVIDAIRAICQMNGVFGKIDANGIFKYVHLEMPSEELPFPSDEIFPGDTLYPANPSEETSYIDKYRNVSFEDYEVAEITGVTVREGPNDGEYGQSGTDTNILLIEGNMWCNGLTHAQKNTIAENILDAVQYAVYQPFEASSVGLPFIECGDAVAYYVYDYSSGTPVTDVMGFTVMTRYLKGIQWMTDTYSANGLEYQPEVKPSISDEQTAIDEINNEIEDMQESIADIGDDVDEVRELINGKQNFIEAYLGQTPSGTGHEGDLVFMDSVPRRLFRYENGAWVRMNFWKSGTAEPDGGEDGDIYLQNNGSYIIGIWEKVNGVWCDYHTPYGHLVDYLTSEQNTEVKYLDGSDIFQRSYFFQTAIALTSNTWTNAVQSNLIGQVIDAKGTNADGDMIGLIGRVNSGYAQVMSLMSANQSLKVLTLQYTKTTGAYDFNENYQQGQTYTFSPSIDAEEFLVWIVKHFIGICKTKSDWASNPTFTYILNNLSTIVARFMQYKGNDNGIGVTLSFNRDYYTTSSAFFIYVTFTNGNKTASIAESYTEQGDASKRVWGNDSQSSLWAKNGVYCYRAYVNKTTGVASEEWVTPEWAYTMYVRYIGIKYGTESASYLGIEDVSNYGIHLT